MLFGECKGGKPQVPPRNAIMGKGLPQNHSTAAKECPISYCRYCLFTALQGKQGEAIGAGVHAFPLATLLSAVLLHESTREPGNDGGGPAEKMLDEKGLMPLPRASGRYGAIPWPHEP